MQGEKWSVYYVLLLYYNILICNICNVYVILMFLIHTFYKHFVLSSVVYPIIHFTEDRNSLMSVLQDQNELNEHFKLHQGESCC